MIEKFSRLRIQTQLTVAIVVGFAITATVVSLSISFVVRNQAENLITTFAYRFAEQLITTNAHHVILDQGDRLIDILEGLPGIDSAMIVESTSALPDAIGSVFEAMMKLNDGRARSRKTYRFDEGGYVHALIPVIIQSVSTADPDRSSIYEPVESRSENVGFVYVVWNSGVLVSDIRFEITVIFAIVFLMITLLYLGLLGPFLRRVTTALSDLTETIRHTTASQRSLGRRLPETGSHETRSLALAFNRLMEERDRAESKLEQKVAERTEELEGVLHFREQFQSMIHHEMKAPLKTIGLFVNLASEKSLFIESKRDREQIQYFLDRIETRALQLLERINRILEISGLESGAKPVNFKVADLDRITTRLLSELTPLAEENSNELMVARLGENPCVIDEQHVESILTELITNACKFTRRGRIEVTVLAAHSQLKITVADTGIGIASDLQTAVFEPFRQVDVGDARVFGGSGLGLAIVARLSALLRGHVRVVSDVGKGATFTVTIPLPRDHEGQGP